MSSWTWPKGAWNIKVVGMLTAARNRTETFFTKWTLLLPTAEKFSIVQGA